MLTVLYMISLAASVSLPATCTPSLERGILLNISIPTYTLPYAERPVLVYIPDAPSGQRLPTLVTLHDFGSNPMANLNQTGLLSYANEFGWVVAAPYGSAPGSPTGCTSTAAPCAWNAGGWSTQAAANHSDVSFLSNVAAYLIDKTCARQDGVFATGFSTGAMMANRLACDAPTVFRGVAPMGGTITLGGDFHSCAPVQPVTWLSFCGSADDDCSIAQNHALGQSASFALFAANCSRGPSQTYLTPTTRCEEYTGCQGNVIIERCIILGLGHQISGHENGGWESATNVDAVRYALNRWSLTLSTQCTVASSNFEGKIPDCWSQGKVMADNLDDFTGLDFGLNNFICLDTIPKSNVDTRDGSMFEGWFPGPDTCYAWACCGPPSSTSQELSPTRHYLPRSLPEPEGQAGRDSQLHLAEGGSTGIGGRSQKPQRGFERSSLKIL